MTRAHSPTEPAERFLDDPFRAQPGARVYRTGDLGPRRADAVTAIFVVVMLGTYRSLRTAPAA